MKKDEIIFWTFMYALYVVLFFLWIGTWDDPTMYQL
jgi:hypothetical protein